LQLSEWESTDSRALAWCDKTNGELDVGALYRLRMFGSVLAPFAWFVWEGFAPSKAKFFAWLLIQSRIQGRAAEKAGVICPDCRGDRETASTSFSTAPSHAASRTRSGGSSARTPMCPTCIPRHAPGVRLGHGIDFHDFAAGISGNTEMVWFSAVTGPAYPVSSPCAGATLSSGNSECLPRSCLMLTGGLHV
jgi:hypothetical protein